MLELVLMGADAPVYSLPLAARPVRIGRSPASDLILTDPSVSTHHALVWVEAGRVFVQDLGSSNGTFVNGRRIRGSTVVSPGDTLGLGPTTELLLAGDEVAAGGARLGIAVEEVATGSRVAVAEDRFVIGDGPDVALRVPGAAPAAATLLVHGNGEVWLGLDTGDQPLVVGEPFTVAGRVFRLVVGGADPVETVVPVAVTYPYELRTWLGTADERPLAVVSDTVSGATCRFEAGNRAIFLYLLARRHAEDARSGVAEAERGWTGDPELLSGLWGRRGDMNRLYVLLHRVRADLKEAGFDPWFLERRRRFLRARVAVALVDPPGRAS